ncbi:hypothetical protein ACOMHN_028447 [Nucella lapillus]
MISSHVISRFEVDRRHGKATREASPQKKKTRTDPLLLTDLVVDSILEFLDDDTLLTGRLVCQRWKREITERTGLWMSRCEGLGAHKPEKTFPPETDFFRVFLNLRRISLQMSSRESWQLDHYCDGSQCVFHEELESHHERQYNDNWISGIVPDIKYVRRFEKEIAICTTHGELIVLDEEKKEVAWRTEKLGTDIIHKFKDVIFTVTSFGNIEVYPLHGKCEVTDTGGKLVGVIAVYAHPTAPFLLVLLRNNQVFLVSDQMQLFPLRLPSPQPSEQQDGQVSTDAEPIVGLFFEMNVAHSDDLLAVAIKRRSSMCFVIFTAGGDVLHHVFLLYNISSEWSAPLERGQGRYRFVCLGEEHIVAHSIHFRFSGITVEQAWKKALPARFAESPHEMIAAGQTFLLALEGTTLQVFRVEDGTLAADFSDFFSSRCIKLIFTRHAGSIDQIVRTVQQVEKRIDLNGEGDSRQRTSERTYIINYDWLNGLSPSTMRPDFPVAVIFSTENLWGSCLRWSDELWGDISLPPKQETDEASDDIAH